MKKIYFLSLLLLSAPHIFSQTLFTFGANAVGKDEFLRAYNKNKTSNIDKVQAYKEYLDLYIKFKLKVQAAKELRLDTIQQLQADVDGFRSQVEEGYMNDDKGVTTLVNEVFERQKKEIHTIHFYVPINTAMKLADSIQATKLIEAAHEALVKGRTDYSEIAAELTAQYKMVLKAEDMGYVTVLSVPYTYENIIYGLKRGEISTSYKTKKAIHLFKNLAERENSGKWKIAQILFVFPPDATTEVKNTIKKTADSVRRLIAAGADFAEMAKKFSNDKNTYMAGGEMAEFSTGKFDFPFESEVFQLKKDGDLSESILTAHGYHIVKRLKQTPLVADNKDENYMFDLKQKVQQDGRINTAKEKFLKDVLVTLKYKRNPLVKEAEIYQYGDSVLKNKRTAKYLINAKPIFSIASKTIKGSDWLKFAKEYAEHNALTAGETSKEIFSKFISVTAFDHYRKNLEKYNTDFKYQMQEFKEGNMLFEIMERNVWSKAANDTIGLKKYYDQNKTKYRWEESADAIVYNVANLYTAEQAVKALKDGKNWKTIADESNAAIQADSGRYELSQLAITEKISEGLISNPVESIDGTANFIQILKLYAPNAQRNFEEAKGLVINEYQNYMEEKWIESLKKKYPVKINDAVFKAMVQ